MQSCLTKFFQPLDSSNAGQYHHHLFQEEEADRLAREQERLARIKEERDRLAEVRRERNLAKRQAAEALRAEACARQRELAEKKLRGQQVVPGLYVGGSLAAQNYEWLRRMSLECRLRCILNVTPTVANYYDESAQEAPEDAADLQVLSIARALPDDESAEPTCQKPSKIDNSATTANCAERDDGALDAPPPSCRLELIYRRIPIEDSREVDLSPYYDAAAEFIDQAILRGESVLVHCKEGRSRSVSMVVAYLLIKRKWTLKEAIEAIEAVVPDHNMNDGFERQLAELEKEVHGKNTLFEGSRRSARLAPSRSDALAGYPGEDENENVNEGFIQNGAEDFSHA
ncbi:uncharacterized protein LOC126320764 [Schistocerca gregaria]|uniref:uncharacterized protein LOC126320764 n=1 Tax=Schistocerca gregaria TaxID=7010 RepID=UPI00211E81C2|nr:uncharacterized protein LOC126320764 [Schistocerca gregaria]